MKIGCLHRSAYKLDGLRARGNARSVCLIGPPWSVMPARRPRRLRACSASRGAGAQRYRQSQRKHQHEGFRSLSHSKFLQFLQFNALPLFVIKATAQKKNVISHANKYSAFCRCCQEKLPLPVRRTTRLRLPARQRLLIRPKKKTPM